MSAGRRSLIVEILSETKGLRAGVKQTEDSLSRIGNAANRVGKLTQMSLGVMSVGAAVALGKQLYQVGMQSEAFGRKYRAVFGDNTAALDEWVAAHHEAFGVAEDEVQGYLADVGQLLINMDRTREEAKGQAVEVLELAGAWSAYSGGTISIPDAMDKLVRGLAGQTRGLIDLNMKITDTEVKARMAAEGVDELTGEEATRAQQEVLWQLIQEKSTAAVGSYEEALAGAYGAAQDVATSWDMLKDKAGEIVVSLAPAVTALAELVDAATAILNLDLTPKTRTEVLAGARRYNPFSRQSDQAKADAVAAAKALRQAGDRWAETVAAEAERRARLIEQADQDAREAAAGLMTMGGELIDPSAIGRTSSRLAHAYQDAVAAAAEMAARTTAAVQAAGASFAELPGLIVAHKGDVAAAMAAIAASLRAERDFEINLRKLAEAGMSNLAAALLDSPDHDAAIAAAQGFAADLGAAADLEAEMRIQTSLAINASNPLNAVYAQRYQAEADHWKQYGAAMAAAYRAGFGTPNPTADPPADVDEGSGDEIPSLAEGGRIRRGGIVRVHSGETVVPAAAARASVGAAGGQLSIEIPLRLNGREIARAIVADVATELDLQRRSRS